MSSPATNPLTFEPFTETYVALRAAAQDLPVTKKMGELLALIAKEQVVILVGPTGSGKTTQLAKALLETDPELQKSGKPMIALTQPRQIASNAVAVRIASELDVKLGGIVGLRYKGCKNVVKGETRLEIVTDGTLLKAAKNDPTFRGYKYIVIDEAHERAVPTDLLLSLLKAIIAAKANPDLRLIVMSATLDAQLFLDFFPGSVLFEVEGRQHKVDISFLSSPCSDIMAETIKTVLWTHLAGCEGNILVFASGVPEIHELIEGVRLAMHGDERSGIAPRFPSGSLGPLAAYSLHAQLPMEEQMQVVNALPPHSATSGQHGRKLIVSTSAAETSITITGVVHVIDMCTTKSKIWDPTDETWTFRQGPTSKARLAQRMGRAGRDRQGFGWGICTQEQYDENLPDQTPPAILQGDMMTEILEMLLVKKDPYRSDYLTPPATSVLDTGVSLLIELGALDPSGGLTSLGQNAGNLPIDPHLGVMLVLSPQYDCASEILSICALMSASDGGGSLWRKAHGVHEKAALESAQERLAHPCGGLLSLLNIYVAWREARDKGDESADNFCGHNMLSRKTLRSADDTRRQLQKILLRITGWKECSLSLDDPNYWAKILRALCRGFFLRVAKRTDTSPARTPDPKNPEAKQADYYGTVRHNVVAELARGPELRGALPDTEWIIYSECLTASKGNRLTFATSVKLEYLIEARPVYWLDVESFPNGSIRSSLQQSLSIMTGKSEDELKVPAPKPLSMR